MSCLEPMTDFFAARVDGYDRHMLENVEGCKEAYIKMAELVPNNAENLLDLGCGTGLELDEIFKVLPGLKVVGVDLTKEMLDVLKLKHSDKNLDLICADYFQVDLGVNKYDVAVSFETMHHFDKYKKTELYKRVCNSLVNGGTYIECDYMVESQDEEDFYFSENARLRLDAGISEDEYYHYDTPCTIENQIKMFKSAGFKTAEQVFRLSGTTIIISKK